MASNYASKLIAVCQMTSTCNKEYNLKTAEQLIKDAGTCGAKVDMSYSSFSFVKCSNYT